MTSSVLLAWAMAPDWITIAQAATLMGDGYTPNQIRQLVDHGDVVAETNADGQLLIELRSLSEYRDALVDVCLLWQ